MQWQVLFFPKTCNQIPSVLPPQSHLLDFWLPFFHPTFSNVPISHSSVMFKVPHSAAAEALLDSTAYHANRPLGNTAMVHCINNTHTMKLQNKFFNNKFLIFNTVQSCFFFSSHFKKCIHGDTTVTRKMR